MAIGYLAPLERAFEHMKGILFRPFDLTKWLVIGFACWLARLSNCSGSGGGGNPTGWTESTDDAEAALHGAAGGLASAADLLDEVPPFVLVLVGCAILLVLILIPVLLWLSSRGNFMFLDDVIHDRAWIKAPWREYRREGNSLFVWQLLFVLAALLAILAAAAPLIAHLVYVGRGGEEPSVGLILLGVLPILAVAIALGYVQLLLIDFVVPVMYRHRLSATAAWGRFLPLLKKNLGRFLLYGLFVFGLYLVIGIGLLVVILATCCIALIVLIVPYVGTVATLPIWVTLRLLPLYFLAQLGPEWQILPLPAGGPPPAPGGEEEPPPLAPPPAEPESGLPPPYAGP